MSPTVREFRERYGDDVHRLIGLLEGEDIMDAMLAVHRLIELDARDAIEPLIRVMHTANEFGLVACTAIALGRFGDVQAVEPLIQFVETAHARAESQADDIRPPKGWRGFMIRISGSRWWDEMRESSCRDVRAIYMRTGIHALGLIGDIRAVEPIRKRLNDSDERVQAAAIEALHRLEVH